MVYTIFIHIFIELNILMGFNAMAAKNQDSHLDGSIRFKRKEESSTRSFPSKTGGDPLDYFWEGCTMAGTPANARTVCNSHDGCISTCLDGYTFPNGKSEFELECENGEWKPKSSSERKKVPKCKRSDASTRNGTANISKKKMVWLDDGDEPGLKTRLNHSDLGTILDVTHKGLDATHLAQPDVEKTVLLTGVFKGAPVLLTGEVESHKALGNNIENHMHILDSISSLYSHLLSIINQNVSDDKDLANSRNTSVSINLDANSDVQNKLKKNSTSELNTRASITDLDDGNYSALVSKLHSKENIEISSNYNSSEEYYTSQENITDDGNKTDADDDYNSKESEVDASEVEHDENDTSENGTDINKSSNNVTATKREPRIKIS